MAALLANRLNNDGWYLHHHHEELGYVGDMPILNLLQRQIDVPVSVTLHDVQKTKRIEFRT